MSHPDGALCQQSQSARMANLVCRIRPLSCGRRCGISGCSSESVKRCAGSGRNVALNGAPSERSLKVRRLLREQDQAGAIPAALTISVAQRTIRMVPAYPVWTCERRAGATDCQLAQLVEREAVNFGDVGANPTLTATLNARLAQLEERSASVAGEY